MHLDSEGRYEISSRRRGDVGTLILIRPGNTTGLLVAALQSGPQGHTRRIDITIQIIRVNFSKCVLLSMTHQQNTK